MVFNNCAIVVCNSCSFATVVDGFSAIAIAQLFATVALLFFGNFAIACNNCLQFLRQLVAIVCNSCVMVFLVIQLLYATILRDCLPQSQDVSANCTVV